MGAAEDVDVCALIERGGVLTGVAGSTVQEVYGNVLRAVPLPEGLTADGLLAELLEREKVLSTAVGNGIAIPHPRRPLVGRDEDRRLIVAFPEQPLDMQAPDECHVGTLFFLLTRGGQFHLQVLSALARLVQDVSFRRLLERRPSQAELLEAVRARMQ